MAYRPKLMMWMLEEDGKTPIQISMDDTREVMARRDVTDKNRQIVRHIYPKGRLSTVFLQVDIGSAPATPTLWETMEFGGEDGELWGARYTSYADAVAGHAAHLPIAVFRGVTSFNLSESPDGVVHKGRTVTRVRTTNGPDVRVSVTACGLELEAWTTWPRKNVTCMTCIAWSPNEMET